MHRRHNEAPSSGRLRKAGGRAKEVRLSMSPDTQVKEQHVPVTSFLKMKWRKSGRFVNSQDTSLSSLLTKEREMKKRGSWASAISLNLR